jgi:hypothetical protein
MYPSKCLLTLIRRSDIYFGVSEIVSTNLPVKRRKTLNAIQPVIDEINNVGKTELFFTLAFLHKS